jgi:hypothetical protein
MMIRMEEALLGKEDFQKGSILARASCMPAKVLTTV